MINHTGINYRAAALAAILFAAVVIPAERISPAGGGSPEVPFRSHLISFLQSGMKVEEIPPSHPLHALRRIPIVTTAAYLVMEHDESLLNKFYPILTGYVMDRFKEDNTIGGGLIHGTLHAGDPGEVYLSPAVNALANLELYSLSLVAQRIGKHEDALELLSWSRRFSEAVTRTFYDPTAGCFFPLREDGTFIMEYSPEQLLPLILDTGLSDKSRSNIIDKFIHKRNILSGAGGEKSYVKKSWDDPMLRAAIMDLLSNSPHLASRRLEVLAAGINGAAPYTKEMPAQKYWLEFWNGRPSSRKELFPSLTAISSLINLTHIIEEKSLMQADEFGQLKDDIDKLRLDLSLGKADLDSHAGTISLINRLLVTISRISSILASEENIWKVFDELKWRELSPRTKKLIKASGSTSLDELMRAKSILSGYFMKSTGIIAEARMPDRPVPIGKKVEVDVSMRSTGDSLEISQVYLQIGDSRRRITRPGQNVTLATGTPAFTYKTNIPLSPTAEPGIVTLPLFFDFLHEGKRVEIHSIESISLAKGYDISLTFPQGRRLGGGPLPIRIILKYQSDHDIQGLVEGAFLKDLRCSPELPARFLVKRGADITTLPLEITKKTVIPPGVYPFSMSVLFNGRPIGSFEENLVCPMRWFHLGPMSYSHWLHENAPDYQDDLFKTHRTLGGDRLNWREVPPGAIDGAGAVLPERLFGNASERCFLLYTVVDAPARMQALWKLETGNNTSLWINSERVISAGRSREKNSTGNTMLRKGLNSFLIASCWRETPDRVLFVLSDETGLPVSGMSNEIDRIIEGFERLSRSAVGKTPETAPHDQLRAVAFELDYPEASDVCVIGSFNNWEPGATTMRKNESGIWAARIPLQAGRYPYKFLVDNKTKMTDPGCKLLEPDGFGGLNSILVVN